MSRSEKAWEDYSAAKHSHDAAIKVAQASFAGILDFLDKELLAPVDRKLMLGMFDDLLTDGTDAARDELDQMKGLFHE